MHCHVDGVLRIFAKAAVTLTHATAADKLLLTLLGRRVLGGRCARRAQNAPRRKEQSETVVLDQRRVEYTACCAKLPCV